MTSTTAIATNEEQTLRQAVSVLENEMDTLQARADHLEDLAELLEKEVNSASPNISLIEAHVQTIEDQTEDLNERLDELNETVSALLGDETAANANAGPTLPSSGTARGEYISGNSTPEDIREVRVVSETNGGEDIEMVRFVDPAATGVNANRTPRVRVVDDPLADPVRAVGDQQLTGSQANYNEVSQATDVIAVNRN